MLTIRELNPLKKEVYEVSLKSWKPGKNTSWIDCFNPTEEELILLSKKTGIPLNDFKESIDLKKRARVVSFKNCSMIVFNGLCAEPNEKENIPIGIFITKKCAITLHEEEIISTEKLRKLQKGQFYESMKNGTPHFVCVFMDYVTDDFFDLLDRIDEDINQIEDEVIKNPTETVIRPIFIQKRRLIMTHKALIANREVLSALEKHYLKEFDAVNIEVLRELCNDVAQLVELVSTYRDILTSILDLYLSSVSNNLNKVMKILTIISAFILVPTLIAGIYGMNFQKTSFINMPELYWEFGYPFALGLMLLSTLIFYIWFKKRGWL